MAQQKTKVIEVADSYQPVDPNTFPETLLVSNRSEDYIEGQRTAAFEGYNFLPTSYGYRSYFGINSTLDVEKLTSRADEIFIVQTLSYENIAVALCEDGIWTCRADSEGANWVHEITLTVPPDGEHYNWTKAIIGNTVYCYRAGENAYQVFSLLQTNVSQGEIEAGAQAGTHPANQFFSVTPNFLNITAQEGIFKAGSRLGFWDSANSIAWSGLDDYADFTPKILTQAGNSIFQEVAGRIVTVLPLGDGFVIYSTKSITSVLKSENATFQWEPVVLQKDFGIAFAKEACLGETHETQYAYSPLGLLKITTRKAEPLVPAVTDFLKESRAPVYPKLVEGRFLFLELLDKNYVDSQVSNTVMTIPTDYILFPPEANLNNAIASSKALKEIQRRQTQPLTEEEAERFDLDLIATGQPQRKPGTPVIPEPSNANWEILKGSQFSPYLEDSWTGEAIIPAFATYADIEPSNKFQSFVGQVVFSYEAPDPAPLGPRPYSILPLFKGHKDIQWEYLPEFPEELSQQARTQWNHWKQMDVNAVESLNSLREVFANTPYVRIGARVPLHVGEARMDFRGQLFPNVNKAIIVDATLPHNPGFSFKRMAYGATGGTHIPLLEGAIPTIRTSYSGLRDYELAIEPKAEMNVEYQIKLHYPDPVGSTAIMAKVNLFFNRITNLQSFYTGYEPVQLGQNVSSYLYEDINGNMVSFFAQAAVNLRNGYEDINVPYVDAEVVEFPPSYFSLQEGSLGPIYPTIPGALVYDIFLNKWGKLKQEYKLLVDWAPLNGDSGNIVPYNTFGMKGGVLKEDGSISLFDKYPEISYLKYGKMGYYRQGFTKAEEIRVNFRGPSTGVIRTEASLDGANIELGLTRETPFENATKVDHFISLSARWHTVSVSGIWDIRYMEFRGTQVSNR